MRWMLVVVLAVLGGCGGGDDDGAGAPDAGPGGEITCEPGAAPPVVLACDGALGDLVGTDQEMFVASETAMLRVDMITREVVAVGASTLSSPLAMWEEGAVYWTTPFDLVRGQLGEAGAEVLYEGDSDLLDLESLVVDPGAVYWSDEAANLWNMLYVEGNPQHIGGPFVSPMRIAVAKDLFAVAADDMVLRIVLDSSEPLATLPGTPSSLVGHPDRAEVFAMTEGGLVGVTHPEGAVYEIADGGSGDLALLEEILYFSRAGAGVYRTSILGDDETEVAAVANGGIGGVFATASNIYWTDGGELRAAPVP